MSDWQVLPVGNCLFHRPGACLHRRTVQKSSFLRHNTWKCRRPARNGWSRPAWDGQSRPVQNGQSRPVQNGRSRPVQSSWILRPQNIGRRSASPEFQQFSKAEEILEFSGDVCPGITLSQTFCPAVPRCSLELEAFSETRMRFGETTSTLLDCFRFAGIASAVDCFAQCAEKVFVIALCRVNESPFGLLRTSLKGVDRRRDGLSEGFGGPFPVRNSPKDEQRVEDCRENTHAG